ncbi:MAG: hypothetical protein N3E45_14185 [Oscillatoriaceae bacterium SKW80]|nr:hypothetical protein [Oscillatoriaceae bacterium SKW80]HIK29100.1 hypothetical protein [Oscillatoriaceae cyanobacterium M7585_C2015_266]
MITNFNDFKIFLRINIGDNPWLYQIYSIKNNLRPLLVNRRTQIVIEGFPRSANTFSFLLFKTANQNVRVAHHIHLSAQIIKAVNLKIPTVVLVREPKDAIASYLIFEPRNSEELCLKYYIKFYKSILPYKAGYVVATYKQVIQNFNIVIKKVNRRFGTNYNIIYNVQEAGNNVLKEIEKLSTNPFKANCPKPERSSLKDYFLQKICHPKNKHLLQEAETIYNQFVQIEQEQ